MVSVDVKHYVYMDQARAQELCESRGGCPGLPVPNSLYGLWGRKATLNRPDTLHSIAVVLISAQAQGRIV